MHTYNNYDVNPDPPHQPMYLNHIKKILNDNKVAQVLDVGCGDGSFSESLSDCGFTVYGFDLEPSGVMKAQARQKGQFTLGDIYSDYKNLFKETAKFDAVISVEVIEHLYDPKKFLYNCIGSFAVNTYKSLDYVANGVIGPCWDYFWGIADCIRFRLAY